MKDDAFSDFAVKTAEHSRLLKTAQYIQHGNTSCLLHSIAVAYLCYRLSIKLGFLKLHRKELVRGALLHDYFLYDWHIPDNSRPMHGRYHPKAAYKNASEDFSLTPIEEDIIKKHMFPLTFTPPSYRESVLVCLIDKACSVYEIFKKNAYKSGPIHTVFEKVRSSRK